MIGKFWLVLKKYSQRFKIATIVSSTAVKFPHHCPRCRTYFAGITMQIYPHCFSCGSRILFFRGRVCRQKGFFCLHGCATSPNTQRSARKSLLCQHSCVHMGFFGWHSYFGKQYVSFFTLFTDIAVWIKYCRAEEACTHNMSLPPQPAFAFHLFTN